MRDLRGWISSADQWPVAGTILSTPIRIVSRLRNKALADEVLYLAIVDEVKPFVARDAARWHVEKNIAELRLSPGYRQPIRAETSISNRSIPQPWEILHAEYRGTAFSKSIVRYLCGGELMKSLEQKKGVEVVGS